jgi:hypothetical protein
MSFGGFLSLVQKFGVGKCVSLAVVGVVCLLRTRSRDDDDEFLYGDSELNESSLSTVAPPVIPSPGEIPFSLHGTAFVFYSFRQNIFDFLLTLSSRARQSMNQMSESSEANYHANTLSLAFHTAFPSARRWKHQTTTSFHRSDHLPSQNLSCRAMTASRWKRTLMQKQRPRTAAKMPTRATRCVLFSS